MFVSPVFVPRYKFIRRECNFDEQAFISDFQQLSFSLVYSTDEPDMQVELLNSLIHECLDQHAPLMRTKVTRPPAPWMKHLNIQQLQQNCRSLCIKAREEKSESDWNQYRNSSEQLEVSDKKGKA